jgi:hypothetical protein
MFNRCWRFSRHALGAGALALAAGCTDQPLDTGAAPGQAGPRLSSAGRPNFTRNTVKYRAQAYQHGSNRSGSASLAARALLGKDGQTALEVTTGELGATSAPGTISKLQVKLQDPNRVTQVAQNFNGLNGGATAHLTFGGRVRHSWVQVQGNIRGIDPRRTDVVTVSERVSLRPDIAATSLGGPEQARVNTSVVFSAAIGELNGDVGATTNCVLYIDGAEADRADGVWVAEGDHVSCDFMHTFAAVGAHTVRVAAEAVNPGDWDVANNSRETTIQIVSPQVSLHGSAYAHQNHSEQYAWLRGTWSSDYGAGNYYDQSGEVYASQSASIYGVGPAGMNVTQASMEFTVSSGGTELVSVSGAMDWTWGNCAHRWGDEEFVHVCSDGASTWVNAGHRAERATYFSRGYSEEWSDWDGWYYYYSEYDYRGETDVGNFRPYGTQVDLSLRVTDGAKIYSAAPTITLTGFEDSWDGPESCLTITQSYANYSSEQCVTGWGEVYYESGSTSF